MPKLIRTSDSDTFLVEVRGAQWRFPCTFLPCFVAMFSVLRKYAWLDDCVVRVCRRLTRSSEPIAAYCLFYEAILDDDYITFAQYHAITTTYLKLSMHYNSGISFMIRCPAS